MSSDKALHALWSFFFTAFIGHWLLWYAVAGAVLMIGILKEWYDSRQPGNHWCWWDILSDIIGIGLAIITLLL